MFCHQGVYNNSKGTDNTVNRRFERNSVKGYYSDVASSNSVCGGIVEDISLTGFKVSQLPDSFDDNQHVYSVIITHGDSRYKILAKLCWDKKLPGSDGVEVGFKIIDAPWEWAALAIDNITVH